MNRLGKHFEAIAFCLGPVKQVRRGCLARKENDPASGAEHGRLAFQSIPEIPRMITSVAARPVGTRSHRNRALAAEQRLGFNQLAFRIAPEYLAIMLLARPTMRTVGLYRSFGTGVPLGS